MNALSRLFLLLAIATCIVAHASVLSELKGLDSHLERYTYSDLAHHDHPSSAQVSLRLLSSKSIHMLNISTTKEDQSLVIKSMISSEYPFSIFRPPVV